MTKDEVRWLLSGASWEGRKYWLLETIDVLVDSIEDRWPRARPVTSRMWSPRPHVSHGDYDLVN